MAGPWEKYQAAPAEQPAQQTGPWSRYEGVSPGAAQAELEKQKSAGAENQPGLMQQLFDIKNSRTGGSYLYGNTPAPTQYEDLQRTVADTVSRGYLDKLQGPEAQARTLAARERMPGWVELPTDIGAAVYSAPYRVGGMGLGALAGGVEGAVSEYGHQDDWTPDAGELWDIAKGAGIGAVTGGVGAKAGQWFGGNRAAKEAEAAKPYKTDADLESAAFSSGSDDLLSRAANVEKIRAAQGSSRDTFAKMLSGLDNASPETQARIAEIAAARGKTIAAGRIADATGKKFPPLPLLAIEAVASGGIPYKTLAGMAVKEGVSRAGRSASQVSGKEIEALAELERNGALKLDPATIDKWRDLAAKTGIGYGREP